MVINKILILIWWKIFFVWYDNYDNTVEQYKKTLRENIFACMEYSKQPYESVLSMPILRFQEYLKWKTDLEEEKMKNIEDLSKLLKSR